MAALGSRLPRPLPFRPPADRCPACAQPINRGEVTVTVHGATFHGNCALYTGPGAAPRAA